MKDTDNGVWDGDKSLDRAVGPTQFIPSTWKKWQADGNGDGVRDPNNIYDATLGTGMYVCAGTRDLSQPDDLTQAILSYNHSREYLNDVLHWIDVYRNNPTGAALSDVIVSPLPAAAPMSPPVQRTAKSDAGQTRKSQQPSEPSIPSREGTLRPASPGPDRPSPPASPARVLLTRVSTSIATATVGGILSPAPTVKVGKGGKPAANTVVTFTIIGSTHARFASGKSLVTVHANAAGQAKVPQISAGDVTGVFAVTAAVRAHAEAGTISFDAVVVPADTETADRLTTPSYDPVKAAMGQPFRQPIVITASRQGKPVSGVGLIAQLYEVDSDGHMTLLTKSGPYMRDITGKPTRSFPWLRTGKNGTIQLPQLFADRNVGSYRIRLLADSAILDIDLWIHPSVPFSPSSQH
nr:lytic transglycosylase domain-containing protein [Streptomyces chartreusis]